MVAPFVKLPKRVVHATQKHLPPVIDRWQNLELASDFFTLLLGSGATYSIRD